MVPVHPFRTPPEAACGFEDYVVRKMLVSMVIGCMRKDQTLTLFQVPKLPANI